MNTMSNAFFFKVFVMKPLEGNLTLFQALK